MGWSIGYDENWKRDIGYGVPAYCDHPECNEEIDRGLGYVCGGEPYGGEDGCGLFFCSKHMPGYHKCERCDAKKKKAPFAAKPDHPDWMRWKLEDGSWSEWRKENPEAVAAIKLALGDEGPKPRGFAAMTPERRKEIAGKGGKTAHEKGTAHQYTSKEASWAGKKGAAKRWGNLK